MKHRTATEIACRALCKRQSLPPDIKFDGSPMWQSFTPEVSAIFAAIGYDGETLLLVDADYMVIKGK